MLGVPRLIPSNAVWFAFGITTAGLLAGCGGTSKSNGAGPDGGVPSDGQAPSGDDDSTPDANVDTGGGSSDDSGLSVPDAADDDAAARNATCTPLSAQTGTLVDTDHGRLDGTLVYVVPISGPSKCNGDNAHVHLQIEVSGSVYDVAVDVGAVGDEVGTYQESLAIPGGAWAEGWHGTDTIGYPALGLKSASFPVAAPADVATQVEALLENTSKISVFCTGYTPGDNGCHDVHYENGSDEDGAIVLDPTAATSPILFFRFQGQTF
jgi:hypothetical protein